MCYGKTHKIYSLVTKFSLWSGSVRVKLFTQIIICIYNKTETKQKYTLTQGKNESYTHHFANIESKSEQIEKQQQNYLKRKRRRKKQIYARTHAHENFCSVENVMTAETFDGIK